MFKTWYFWKFDGTIPLLWSKKRLFQRLERHPVLHVTSLTKTPTCWTNLKFQLIKVWEAGLAGFLSNEAVLEAAHWNKYDTVIAGGMVIFHLNHSYLSHTLMERLQFSRNWCTVEISNLIQLDTRYLKISDYRQPLHYKGLDIRAL